MPRNSSPLLRLEPHPDWQATREKSGPARRGVRPDEPLSDKMLAQGQLELADRLAVRPSGRRSATTFAPLRFNIDNPGNEAYVLLVQHASGAVTFHPPDAQPRRIGRGPAASQPPCFSVHLAPPPAAATAGRRGIVGAIVRAVLLRVARKAVEALAKVAVPELTRAFEERVWEDRKLHRGWLRLSVDPSSGLVASPLEGEALAEALSRTEPKLLFLHGTFSHALAAFGPLARTHGSGGPTLFEALHARYGDRIFAFNHFTLCQRPHENAINLVDTLPPGVTAFDVITHSRGGLVLRNLVERAGALGPNAGRFSLGHAVLVGCPSLGTPLATPKRWDDALGWIANLTDMFPDNPFALGLQFVSEGLVWLAHGIVGNIPGLAAQAVDSPDLAELNLPPAPPAGSVSALVANYSPDATLLQRLADLGVDSFFGCANDLVVPTEGGWHVGHPAPGTVDQQQIGCFGAGGNLDHASDRVVHHCNFFAQPATVDFIVAALANDHHQPMPPQGLATPLPYAGVRRGPGRSAAPGPVAAGLGGRRMFAAAARGAAPVELETAPAASIGSAPADEALHLMLVTRPNDHQSGQLVAAFRNARVVEKFQFRHQSAGRRWQAIIARQEAIRAALRGKPGAPAAPEGPELVELGRLLFNALLPAGVLELYRVARASRAGLPLDLVVTSMVDWIAAKPWELAYQDERCAFLALDQVNFVRNPFTRLPAPPSAPTRGPLRILVIAARPADLGPVSATAEVGLIQTALSDLVQQGLARVTICARGTFAELHERVETESFDVVHFVGHGAVDDACREGRLFFETDARDADPQPADKVRQVLCGRGIRLVFLNACETAGAGIANFNEGVAPALVVGGMPAVVANQYPVLDRAATVFARHFYRALAHGLAVADAVREARIAVNYGVPGRTLEWAVPVLFAHDPRTVLCLPAAGPAGGDGGSQHQGESR